VPSTTNARSSWDTPLGYVGEEFGIEVGRPTGIEGSRDISFINPFDLAETRPVELVHGNGRRQVLRQATPFRTSSARASPNRCNQRCTSLTE
jgi:hypothetical protein